MRKIYFGFVSTTLVIILAGAGCNNASNQTAQFQTNVATTAQPTSNNTQKNTVKEQQNPTPEIKKADTSNWTAGSFEEITFKYPANFIKLQNGTMPDAKSIVLWTPDNKDYVEIERYTNLKLCNKSSCKNQSDKSPVTAQEWFDRGSKSDARYMVTLQNIDGHKTAISVAKNTNTVTIDSYSQEARQYDAMILNGDSIYIISLTTSDDKTALIADFYSLLDTVHFVK